ncbi:acyltransferase family protein [Sinorhizobium terangae]|uniref:acyltransferase family protein n=1 Tax=Sinorhizobium terangae TaxID=110322 RepID=UPI00129644AC|nr:acyltransferase [Sinorhizobium terangae]MBB4189338.1 peptidoglycan/LPS O-acetylase OafA/YrhL [Sinorhizobium terangae]WFU49565.1 acyltransferase [Sinorhizobium terangae]
MVDLITKPSDSAVELHATLLTSGHLVYIHYFRAVAILQILVLHACRVFMLRGFDEQVPPSNRFLIVNDILFHDTTMYLAIISGIIYSTRLSKRPTFLFYKQRFLRVVVPYIVMSMLFSTLLFFRWNGVEGIHDLIALTKFLSYNVLWGEAQNTYWYIPVVVLLYALSPILHRLLTTAARYPMLIAAVTLPLFFSRTGTDVTIATCIFFTGTYVIGLYMGEDVEGRLGAIARYLPLLGVVAAITTALLWFLYTHGIDKWGPTSLRESVHFVQKLALGALILIWLWRRCKDLPLVVARTLDLVALSAFGLYLLHGFVFRICLRIASAVVASPDSTWNLIGGGAIIFCLGLLSCLVIIFLLRVLLGKHSRLLVG